MADCTFSPSLYPCSLDTISNIPYAIDGTTAVIASVVNTHLKAIFAIESELGVLPSGTYGTVRARLDALEAVLAALSGDIGSITGTITVQQTGVQISNAVKVLNFTGNVTVTQTSANTVQVAIVGAGDAEQESFTATAGQTIFALGMMPSDPDTVQMFINGSKQEHGIGNDYNVVGTTVTYTSVDYTIQNGDIVEFWYLVTGGSSGGGGDGYVEIKDEGSTIVAQANILDFQGSGVTVTSGGANTAVITVTGGGGGGDGYIVVEDESVQISAQVRTLNFVGADVQAIDAGGYKVNIFIPPPSYSSHWNTNDGTTTGTVSENISRTTTRISTPTSEGNPFLTGGWAGTDQATTTSTSVTVTSAGNTTGFGGDSTMSVTLYRGDGTTLDSYTTPALTGNAVHTSPSGYISVTITNYAAEGLRFRAKASVAVSVNAAITADGDEGGRYHVVASHTVDSVTDGSGTYTYTQPDVFLDANPTTPDIDGYVQITETTGLVLTKHLSGIEYYILGSDFTGTVTNIDQLNRDTRRIPSQYLINVEADDYGLATLQHHPEGTGAANFLSWTNSYNIDDVNYQITNWEITSASYRFRGTTANGSALVRDPWANSSTINSSDASILVDTYVTNSTNEAEYFNDEARRHEDGYFLSVNGLYGDDGYVSGNWDETSTLVSGEALIMGGQLLVPNQSTLEGESSASNTNWSTFKPDLGGANPNYTSLGAPVSYYRTFVDNNNYASISSFTMTFSGTFVANATTDLANSDLEITVWKINSTVLAPDATYHKGPPEHAISPNNHPLSLHGAEYNFGTFNDYSAPTPDGQIRLSSSSGNTVQATFGGYAANEGIHCQITINNAAIKIDSITISFTGT